MLQNTWDLPEKQHWSVESQDQLACRQRNCTKWPWEGLPRSSLAGNNQLQHQALLHQFHFFSLEISRFQHIYLFLYHYKPKLVFLFVVSQMCSMNPSGLKLPEELDKTCSWTFPQSCLIRFSGNEKGNISISNKWPRRFWCSLKPKNLWGSIQR